LAALAAAALDPAALREGADGLVGICPILDRLGRPLVALSFAAGRIVRNSHHGGTNQRKWPL